MWVLQICCLIGNEQQNIHVHPCLAEVDTSRTNILKHPACCAAEIQELIILSKSNLFMVVMRELRPEAYQIGCQILKI